MMWMGNIFDPLVQKVGPEGEFAPGLATSWERIDQLTWRFHLRKGVRFHNGNPFTWEDVQFSFERMKDPKRSEHSWANSVDSVETVNGDAWVIDITTKEPTASFVHQVKIGFIVDKESTLSRTPEEVIQYPIGTGAYKFVEWIKGSYLELEANEDYWEGPPPIKNVTVKPIIEASTRFAALVTGEIDLMMGVPLQMLEAVQNNPKLVMITRPSRRAIFLGLSNEQGLPTSNVKVRKAMYMAINEEEIIEVILCGQATIVSQIVDPATFGYNADIERFPYDQERAKELLIEAGYPDGFKITLQCTNDRYVKDEQIGQAVVKYLQEVGIDAELDAMPKANYWGLISGHETKFWMLGWMNESHSVAQVFSDLVHSPSYEKGYGGWNSTYGDPELDKLIEESKLIEDREESLEALRELNRIAMEEKVAYIPLHLQQQLYATQKDKGINFMPRPDRWIFLKEIAIEG
jgi:peptide/nickel transport system substrate-binding protein